jgi:hypothetical protein
MLPIQLKNSETKTQVSILFEPLNVMASQKALGFANKINFAPFYFPARFYSAVSLARAETFKFIRLQQARGISTQAVRAEMQNLGSVHPSPAARPLGGDYSVW